MFRFTRSGPLLLVIGLTLTLSGCSKESMDELVASAKEKGTQLSDATSTIKEQVGGAAATVTDQAERMSDKVKSVLPGSGEITLQLDSPVTFSRADLQLYHIGAKRPMAMQVTTYRTENPIDTFPSLMMYAAIDAVAEPPKDVSGMLNQPIACRLFLQREAAGAIYSTADGKPVTVTLRSVDSESGLVSGDIAAGELVGTDGETISLKGGKLSAAVAPVIGGGAS